MAKKPTKAELQKLVDANVKLSESAWKRALEHYKSAQSEGFKDPWKLLAIIKQLENVLGPHELVMGISIGSGMNFDLEQSVINGYLGETKKMVEDFFSVIPKE